VAAVTGMITTRRIEGEQCNNHGKTDQCMHIFGRMPFLSPVSRYEGNIKILIKECVWTRIIY
jgi:hypothetical protein